MPHISIVSPIYMAEGCVSELCRRLKQTLDEITSDYEIILVDDRSPDDSWSVIQNEAKQDNRVKGVRLARNFGQHRAITAGLDLADGDWVVVMDCDLQDSPEDISLLYAKAIEGNEIVVAQFEERAESLLHQFLSKVFWRSLSWLAGITFDYKIGNFRIMSKRVVSNFRSYREQLRLLGGITNLMGFTIEFLPVKRNERFSGDTSYSFKKRLAISIDIAMAYSDKPLKISVIAGLIISGLSIIVGIVVLILAYSNMIEVPGWTSVIVSLYFIGGLIIANLGVVGFYIGKVFDETKRRPLYIIENKTNDSASEVLPVFRVIQPDTGSVKWITGLSGSGKSTLAAELTSRLLKQGEKVILLDGDELREVFGALAVNVNNHGRDGRLALAFQYSHLCRILSAQGFTVIIATISLFKEVHTWNRENLPEYFEVYLKVPIEELRRRDPKDIYQRFDAGEIKNVAGLDLKVDEPEEPDWIADFDANQTVEGLADELLEAFITRRNK